jgi:phosphate transport system protein
MKRLIHDLASMAELVERNVNTAVMALVDRNKRFAYEVISLDTDIDEMEILVDRQCLALLAAAGRTEEDFRFLAAAMKINNDLERIGNQAVVICEQVLALAGLEPARGGLAGLGDMLERVEVMVLQSVEALASRNSDLAWQIWEEHAGAEEDLRLVMDSLVQAMDGAGQGRAASHGIHMARSAMALARVSEHTKDIAEEVIYMREGIIVKHHEREYKSRRRKSAPGKTSGS